MNDFESYGFYKWASKVKAWSYRIWALPKGGNGHWTLLIIVFERKEIIYIDSLHGNLQKQVLEKLCKFIQVVFSRADMPL